MAYASNQELVLYTGSDDSNHAGQNNFGEIIVTTFSFHPDDGVPKTYPNRRRVFGIKEWLNTSGCDYLFTILPSCEATRGGHNLVLVAPLLVRKYIQQHPEIHFHSLHIYLDGAIKGQHRQFVRGDFPRITTLIEGFNKKRHSEKCGKKCVRIYCPKVVVAADNIANELYRTCTLADILEDSRKVMLDLNEIAERHQRLRHFS
jgi:hypothetical protein